MQAGVIIKQDVSLDVSVIINGLRTYIEGTLNRKSLVQPLVQFYSYKPTLEHAEEVSRCSMLQGLAWCL